LHATRPVFWPRSDPSFYHVDTSELLRPLFRRDAHRVEYEAWALERIFESRRVHDRVRDGIREYFPLSIIDLAMSFGAQIEHAQSKLRTILDVC